MNLQTDTPHDKQKDCGVLVAKVPRISYMRKLAEVSKKATHQSTNNF